MSNVRALFKRELSSYFITPIAYVFIFVFLVLSSAFTFYPVSFLSVGRQISRLFLTSTGYICS